MSVTLKPYSEYKESNLRWLGKVPTHWNVRRVRNTAELLVSNVDKHTSDGELPVRLCNYVDVYKNDRVTDRIRFMKASAQISEIEQFRLKVGDVVITKDSEAWNDIGVPALVEYEAQDLLCGYHLAILRPFENCMQPDYLFRALQSSTTAYQFHIEANGVTRYGLSHSAIKSVWLPVPPLGEQASIANFLDQFDRSIQKLIRAKRRVIELLNEQKRAVILRAVTRGVDPNAPLKPSGIGWLGDIPEHWEIWQIGHFAQIGNGSTPSRGKAAYWAASGYPWLNSSTVNQDVITSSDQFVTDLALKECHLPRVSPGSVLIAITGQGKTRGTSALLGIEATINQHIAFVTPDSSVIADEYLQMQLAAAYSTLRSISSDSGSTKGALTCADIKHFRVALPPMCEQKRIVNLIRRETLQVEASISQTKREIELLREYRTRLIADVVTGKLDVRGVELPELDEIEEVSDLEDEEQEDSEALVAVEESVDAD